MGGFIDMFDWQYDLFIESKAKFNLLPAGRRSGKTQGATRGAIHWAAKGEPCLWVDTVYTNIDRYVERYFLPDLNKSGLEYTWNAQKKLLKIEEGYIDFRSADRPESIEGFGYKRIYLNEAGIILNNDYLYTNTILPMLMDYEGSKLYAFGTPKGQTNKKGEPHKFYELWLKALEGQLNYAGIQLSSHSNPRLSKVDLEILITEIRKIDPDALAQEIGAEFIAGSKERVFNYDELEYFDLTEYRSSERSRLREAGLGAIDVADEGTDAYSFPIGELIGNKIYIVDWIFTKENTRYTKPATVERLKLHKLDYCSIETNNHGSVVHKELEDEVDAVTFMPIFNTAKKHSRIIQNAGFIKSYFVFRNDYPEDSEYGRAMRELIAYTKDGKAKHEDAPDSLAQLATVARDLFEATWYGA